jgi:hypothetical protein
MVVVAPQNRDESRNYSHVEACTTYPGLLILINANYLPELNGRKIYRCDGETTSKELTTILQDQKLMYS